MQPPTRFHAANGATGMTTQAAAADQNIVPNLVIPTEVEGPAVCPGLSRPVVRRLDRLRFS
jgi:hypothetical protein